MQWPTEETDSTKLHHYLDIIPIQKSNFLRLQPTHNAMNTLCEIVSRMHNDTNVGQITGKVSSYISSHVLYST